MDCHFIRENLVQGIMSTIYISTKNQPTDLLTKGLSRLQHHYLTSNLGVFNILTFPKLRGNVKDSRI